MPTSISTELLSTWGGTASFFLALFWAGLSIVPLLQEFLPNWNSRRQNNGLFQTLIDLNVKQLINYSRFRQLWDLPEKHPGRNSGASAEINLA